MRKMNVIFTALFAMTAVLSANETEVAVTEEAAAVKKAEQCCSNLSNDELSFANNLNEKCKMAFCEKLSLEQRKAAMKMSSNTSCAGAQRCSEKKTLTPNEAVQRVLSDNNIAMEEVVGNSLEPVAQAQ